MKQIREKLKMLAEEDYKKFNEKIIPGARNMLGIRLPKIREIAKARAKENPQGFLEEIEAALNKDRDSVYYEEIMSYGLVIGYARFSDEERMAWLDKFRKHIDNWAVCDSCCMTYKWMKKHPDVWWEYLVSCIGEKTEYSIRFAVVCMLDHFVEEEYLDRLLEWCDRICAADRSFWRQEASGDKDTSYCEQRNDGADDLICECKDKDTPYYVQMAAAWAVSVCYVKFPKETHAFLEVDKMDTFTHNESIQKICESYRITKEQKAAVRDLKR